MSTPNLDENRKDEGRSTQKQLLKERNRRLGIILCLLFAGLFNHRNDGNCYEQ